MNKEKIEVLISSDLRYEFCVAEGEINEEPVFRINMEHGRDKLQIEFEDEKFSKAYDLNNFLSLVEKAKKRLLEEK
jgi:hypothetical protein